MGDAHPTILLRRYLKLISRYCEQNQLLDLPLSDIGEQELPFEIMALPYKLENVEHRVLWVKPQDSSDAKADL
ncbi:hypothetical protein [Leptolyngbya sp. PCC 6406]|uniref:hypothetical protein n=1 Tax=Leptolyngbya sp. PCC 6406 TaxID=1173264 RepID=UPI0003098AF0|nr:hypothetical protein [Leptolyngbya sp. PCC 6406]